jgi:hypothetical protein
MENKKKINFCSLFLPILAPYWEILWWNLVVVSLGRLFWTSFFFLLSCLFWTCLINFLPLGSKVLIYNWSDAPKIEAVFISRILINFYNINHIKKKCAKQSSEVVASLPQWKLRHCMYYTLIVPKVRNILSIQSWKFLVLC